MSYIVIYPIVNEKFFVANNSPRDAFFKPNDKKTWGDINPVKNINLEFTVGDSLIDKTLDGEGFFIYHYKDEINDKLFMFTCLLSSLIFTSITVLFFTLSHIFPSW